MTGVGFATDRTDEVWARLQTDDRPRILRAFWATVRKTDGCWERWRRHRPRKFQYRKFLGTQQHRVSWMIHFGQIPDGLYVCHTCDNHPCVRPDHLFLGTPQQNTDDMYSKVPAIVGKSNEEAAALMLGAMRQFGFFSSASRSLGMSEGAFKTRLRRLGLVDQANALRSDLSRKSGKLEPAAPEKGST